MSHLSELRKRQFAKVMAMVLVAVFSFSSVPAIAAGENNVTWNNADGSYKVSPEEDFEIDENGIITEYIGGRDVQDDYVITTTQVSSEATSTTQATEVTEITSEDNTSESTTDDTAQSKDDTDDVVTDNGNKETDDANGDVTNPATDGSDSISTGASEEEKPERTEPGDEVVVIPTEIGGVTVTGISGAFYNDTVVKTVMIPDTVKTIGDKTFYGCSNLSKIAVYSTSDRKTKEEIENDSSLNYSDFVLISSVPTAEDTEEDTAEDTEATASEDTTTAAEEDTTAAPVATETQVEGEGDSSGDGAKDTSNNDGTEPQADALYCKITGINVDCRATISNAVETMGVGVFVGTKIQRFQVMEGSTTFKHGGEVAGGNSNNSNEGEVGTCLLSADGKKLYCWAMQGENVSPNTTVTRVDVNNDLMARYVKEEKISGVQPTTTETTTTEATTTEATTTEATTTEVTTTEATTTEVTTTETVNTEKTINSSEDTTNTDNQNDATSTEKDANNTESTDTGNSFGVSDTVYARCISEGVITTSEADVYALPAGIEEILPHACRGLRMGSQLIMIPNTVKIIGDYAFFETPMQYVNFEEVSQVEKIGKYAFKGVNGGGFSTILPKSVKEIGEGCFSGIENGCPYIGATSIESLPVYCFSGSRTMHSMIMPESLKTIENYAFGSATNLDEVLFIGDSLEKIGAGSFIGCNTLHEIVIPEGVTSIEEETFSGCGNLGIVGLPESLKEIKDEAFKDCHTIHEMVIPEGVDYIAPDSFDGANTSDIDTSKNELAQTIISHNPVTPQPQPQPAPQPTPQPQPTTEAPPATPAIGTKKTFKGVKYQVTNSEAGNMTVKVTGPKKKSVTSVKIPDTVVIDGFTYTVGAIAKNAFKGCKKLKSVTIGKNVWYIGDNAFNGCKKLKSITIKSKKLTKVGKNAIKGIAKKAKIKVPKSKLKKYKKLFRKKTGYKKSMKIKK